MLVSPRSTGTNTPLKIYQYLRSGRVIVATRLLTHTQVLSDDVAILTDPTPEAFAQGVLRAVNDPALSSRLGAAARHLADTRYTYDASAGSHPGGAGAAPDGSPYPPDRQLVREPRLPGTMTPEQDP